jgi:hypothetical protein
MGLPQNDYSISHGTGLLIIHTLPNLVSRPTVWFASSGGAATTYLILAPFLEIRRDFERHSRCFC